MIVDRIDEKDLKSNVTLTIVGPDNEPQRENLEGIVTVTVTYPDGNQIVFKLKNRIVAQGRDYMLRNTIGVNTVNINYIVFSDSTTTPSDSETQTPGTWRYAVTATKSVVATRQVRWSATLDGGASGVSGYTLGSIALCIDNTNYNEFARVKLPTTINLTSGVTVNVQYDVTIS